RFCADIRKLLVRKCPKNCAHKLHAALGRKKCLESVASATAPQLMTAYAASRAWLVAGHGAGDEISHAGAKSYKKGKPIRIEEFEPEKVWRGRGEDGFKDRVENE